MGAHGLLKSLQTPPCLGCVKAPTRTNAQATPGNQVNQIVGVGHQSLVCNDADVQCGLGSWQADLAEQEIFLPSRGLHAHCRRGI